MQVLLNRSAKRSLRAITALVSLLSVLGYLPSAYAFVSGTGEGTTWRTQASGTRNELDSVYFTPNGQDGWAVGFDGTILTFFTG